MIYYPLSHATRSQSVPAAANAVFTANGQALAGDVVAGAYGVFPSTGAAGEQFAGFLSAKTSASPFIQSSAVQTEELTLSVSGTAVLKKVPLAGTVGLYNTTTNSAVSSANFSIAADGTLTCASAASAQVRVVYSYSLSVNAARAKFGDIQPGGYFGNTIGRASVHKQGTIYTDQFDTTVSWEDATAVKLAAGGKVTNQAGAGTTIPASIVHIPTAALPFLGLSINAA